MRDSTFVASMQRAEQTAPPNMAWVPGGTFRMGSEQHYPEEAPVHAVSLVGFWIDRTPVTNRQFKEFVRATGHRTFAEIPPDPKNYPGALPHMLYAGSLVFTPPLHPVDLKNLGEWWAYTKGADWRHPYGPKSNINGLDQDSPQGHQGRLASVRAELLPPLPTGGPPCGGRGYVRNPSGIPMCRSRERLRGHSTLQ